MNCNIRSLSPFVVAMASLSANPSADPPGFVSSASRHSKEEPSARKQVTFHVIGMMKTQSGAT